MLLFLFYAAVLTSAFSSYKMEHLTSNLSPLINTFNHTPENKQPLCNRIQTL